MYNEVNLLEDYTSVDYIYLDYKCIVTVPGDYTSIDCIVSTRDVDSCRKQTVMKLALSYFLCYHSITLAQNISDMFALANTTTGMCTHQKQ